jgi:hypothetical protein
MRALAFLCTAAFVAGTIGTGKGPNAATVVPSSSLSPLRGSESCATKC